MKKNRKMLVVFALLGLVVGSIVTQVVQDVEAVQFLTKSVTFQWAPRADLDVIRYAFDIHLKLNLMNVLGVFAGVWIQKKI
jgi:hypothetical protein